MQVANAVRIFNPHKYTCIVNMRRFGLEQVGYDYGQIRLLFGVHYDCGQVKSSNKCFSWTNQIVYVRNRGIITIFINRWVKFINLLTVYISTVWSLKTFVVKYINNTTTDKARTDCTECECSYQRYDSSKSRYF